METIFPKLPRITAEEYYIRTANIPERTELLEGEIVAMLRRAERISGFRAICITGLKATFSQITKAAKRMKV